MISGYTEDIDSLPLQYLSMFANMDEKSHIKISGQMNSAAIK